MLDVGWGGNATAMPVSGWSHYHQAEQARLAQQQSGNLGGGANDANTVGGSNTKPPKAPGQKDDSSPLDDFSRTLAARAAAAWAALKGRRREEEGDGQDNSSEGGNGTDGLDTDGLLAAPIVGGSGSWESNEGIKLGPSSKSSYWNDLRLRASEIAPENWQTVFAEVNIALPIIPAAAGVSITPGIGMNLRTGEWDFGFPLTAYIGMDSGYSLKFGLSQVTHPENIWRNQITDWSAGLGLGVDWKTIDEVGKTKHAFGFQIAEGGVALSSFFMGTDLVGVYEKIFKTHSDNSQDGW